MYRQKNVALYICDLPEMPDVDVYVHVYPGKTPRDVLVLVFVYNPFKKKTDHEIVSRASDHLYRAMDELRKDNIIFDSNIFH
ncbi:hypothetical protein STSV2_11 [Sulfolobus virus STSV2]|uniref:hypothetical protein n=1 Tax=Sulfolobus virus STSV2 TaxID=1123964 RepID=UPI0002A81C7F|nr:hypothetical protein STSV2_11 [Sulfolobus virus STSV2]AFU91990.1 hypothetical protein STSV2_11 [Sulfolobus virus STSV2]